MFYYIKGELVMTEPGIAVIDCGGVGYKLAVSVQTEAHLTKLGESVCLFTYFNVREDAAELLGFYTREELAAFKMLITVSGIGPKAAMAILSVLTPEKFALAVSAGDAKAIAKAQGIGNKIAARIILELKDKVAKEFSTEIASSDVPTDASDASDLGATEEAVTALMVLGYTRQEAQAAMKGVSPLLPLEDMITAALRKMAARLG